MSNAPAPRALPEIACPTGRRTVGCHLLVVLARPDGRMVASRDWPFPLVAVRAGTTKLAWIDGITTASAHLAPIDAIQSPPATTPLGVSVGDARSSAMAGDTLLVMTSTGLLAFADRDRSPRVVAPEPAGWALAASGHTAAWITGVTGSDEGNVKSLDLARGTVTTIASGETRPAALAVDGRHVVWTTLGLVDDGAVRDAVFGGSQPVTIASNQPAPMSIAADAGSVYWLTARAGGRRLCRAPLAGGAARTVADLSSPAMEQGAPRLRVSGDDVYFLIGGTLGRVSRDGGPADPVALLPPHGRVVDFDVDDARLYLAVEIAGAT